MLVKLTPRWRILDICGRIFSAASNTRTENTRDKSAVRLCHQVAAWVPHTCSHFYLARNHKIADSQQPAEAREKISTDWESLDLF
jgi:hypothetical protein